MRSLCTASTPWEHIRQPLLYDRLTAVVYGKRMFLDTAESALFSRMSYSEIFWDNRISPEQVTPRSIRIMLVFFLSSENFPDTSVNSGSFLRQSEFRFSVWLSGILTVLSFHSVVNITAHKLISLLSNFWGTGNLLKNCLDRLTILGFTWNIRSEQFRLLHFPEPEYFTILRRSSVLPFRNS